MFAEDNINPYVHQEVMSATPVRLRWMLIRRAEELCGVVDHLWKNGDNSQADQWLLRIREILGELLDGVTDSSNPLGKTVADFYVFLIQLATEIGSSRSTERLGTLRELLNIELETWRQVLENLGESSDRPPPAQSTGKIMPSLGKENPLSGGSFSLEV